MKLNKENNRRLRFLTVNECEALLKACPTRPPLRQVRTLALNTGMRRGEILNLRWQDVNLRERYVELVDQKNGETGTVSLNEAAIDTLRSVPRRLDSDYVFTGRVPGQPFHDLKGRFERAGAVPTNNSVAIEIVALGTSSWYRPEPCVTC